MQSFELEFNGGPIICAAVHDGSRLRPEIKDNIALDELQKLREEAPTLSDLFWQKQDEL